MSVNRPEENKEELSQDSDGLESESNNAAGADGARRPTTRRELREQREELARQRQLRRDYEGSGKSPFPESEPEPEVQKQNQTTDEEESRDGETGDDVDSTTVLPAPSVGSEQPTERFNADEVDAVEADDADSDVVASYNTEAHTEEFSAVNSISASSVDNEDADNDVFGVDDEYDLEREHEYDGDEEQSRDALNASLASAMREKHANDKQALNGTDSAVVASEEGGEAVEDDQGTEEDNKKATKITAIVLGIILLVVGAAAAWWYLADDEEEEIPEPTPTETEETKEPEPEMVVVPEAEALAAGETEIDEEAICEPFIEVGLECSVVEEFDDEIARGQVISQSVEAGEEAEVETEIEIVYSAGPEESVMPEVNNEPVDDVVDTLYALGVDIEEAVYEEGADLAEDRVVSASVDTGETVENGTLVTLNVSDGMAIIPDWEGELQETVEDESSELSVTVEFEAEESEETSGTVLSQSDTGLVEFGSDITVTIAVPFENVPLEIPDVIDETPELAQADLAEAGFRNITSVSVPSTEVDEPTVTQVVPGVGSTGMSEEQVVLIVSEPNDDVDEEDSAEDIADVIEDE